MTCVDCAKEIRGIVYRALDGRPRCGRCHVFAAEKKRQDARQ